MSRDISNKTIRQHTKHVQNVTFLGCTYIYGKIFFLVKQEIT